MRNYTAHSRKSVVRGVNGAKSAVEAQEYVSAYLNGKLKKFAKQHANVIRLREKFDIAQREFTQYASDADVVFKQYITADTNNDLQRLAFCINFATNETEVKKTCKQIPSETCESHTKVSTHFPMRRYQG